MANPRQRRKTRSSSYRPVSHSRHAKKNLKKTPPIRGPKVLQDAWDKRKTVKQNYTALGLVDSLNPTASGGVEGRKHTDDISHSVQSSSDGKSSSNAIPQGFGKIVRDEEGNIIRVELNEEDRPRPQRDDAEMDMEQAAPVLEPRVLSRWAIASNGENETENQEAVTALRQISVHATGSHTLSFSSSGIGPRHASSGELAYLRRLVDRYGDDVEGMARDRKLNPDQRTAGELRRALRRAGLGIGHSS